MNKPKTMNTDTSWANSPIHQMIQNFESPTPETDAAKHDIDEIPAFPFVSCNFARKLERERDRCQELADGLVDRLVTTQERMINAERICNKIYIARNITHSEESMLSAIAEIDKIYRTKNDGN